MICTFFFIFFSIITECSIWFPVIYSGTLLFIHPVHNSLHLLIPKVKDSWSLAFRVRVLSPEAVTKFYAWIQLLSDFKRDSWLKHAQDNWDKGWNMLEGCKPERARVRFIIYMNLADLWKWGLCLFHCCITVTASQPVSPSPLDLCGVCSVCLPHSPPVGIVLSWGLEGVRSERGRK